LDLSPFLFPASKGKPTGIFTVSGGSLMKPSPEATYERARRLANVLAWTISLQCRRIRSSEPEDDQFLFRQWADYVFLINALSRLRKVAVLASKVPPIKAHIKKAIIEFDQVIPGLATMRNTLEHVDKYALDLGRNAKISRRALEVGKISDEQLEWLGCILKTKDAMKATALLFKAIVEGLDILQAHNNSMKKMSRPNN
jgi:hypothetical protein